MFTVRVADNFHPMDRDEEYTHGTFSIWSDAVFAAQGIVDRSLAEHTMPDMDADALYAAYAMFGEDPYITPEPDGEHFSARDYALSQCAALFG